MNGKEMILSLLELGREEVLSLLPHVEVKASRRRELCVHADDLAEEHDDERGQ